MTVNAALLFAAGFGTRMQPLTLDRPKPLIEVAGKTLLDHALDLCAPLELSSTVVNTHYLHSQIETHLSNRAVTVSHETPQILETGGGLKKAMPLLGSAPYFTLNTDAIWRGPNPLEALHAAWDPSRMEALLLCVPIDNCIGREAPGDFSIDTEGLLQRGGPFVYSGAQIIVPNGIEDITEDAFSLNVLWDQMAARGTLFGLPYGGTWCDVGRPEGIALAEDMLSHV